MIPGSVTMNLCDESLLLLPGRGLYWPRRRMLLISDTHWGKAEVFREAAIPIPDGLLANDLARLSAMLEQTQCEQLVVLGDWWHGPTGITEGVLASLFAWRKTHADIVMRIVRGNHDRRAGDPPDELRMECLNEPLAEPPFRFRHIPQASEEGYVLAGHLHPGIVLHGSGKQRYRLPCFWFGARSGVLPAFGGFTGLSPVVLAEGDQVFVVAEDEVLPVPLPPGRAMQ